MNIINLVVNIIFPLIPFRVHLLHTKASSMIEEAFGAEKGFYVN